jgi:hypothetical protein
MTRTSAPSKAKLSRVAARAPGSARIAAVRSPSGPARHCSGRSTPARPGVTRQRPERERVGHPGLPRARAMSRASRQPSGSAAIRPRSSCRPCWTFKHRLPDLDREGVERDAQVGHAIGRRRPAPRAPRPRRGRRRADPHLRDHVDRPAAPHLAKEKMRLGLEARDLAANGKLRQRDAARGGVEPHRRACALEGHGRRARRGPEPPRADVERRRRAARALPSGADVDPEIARDRRLEQRQQCERGALQREVAGGCILEPRRDPRRLPASAPPPSAPPRSAR